MNPNQPTTDDRETAIVHKILDSQGALTREGAAMALDHQAAADAAAAKRKKQKKGE